MKSSKLAVLIIVVLLLQACGYADTLGVPLIGQADSNWCWDASSNMILQYYGYTHTQTEVATWAVSGQNVGNHLSSTTVGPLASPVPPPATYNRKGCGLVLTEFGPIDSTFFNRCLTMDEVKEQIDGERPAMLAVRWLKNGVDKGGHAIVLRGYTGTQISLNDPWPANNDPCLGCAGVSYLVEYDAMFDVNGPPYCFPTVGSAVIGNRWAQTLETGRTLDLCFLIDSTGSMGDDIASVKSSSLTLIDYLVANYKNLRLAVVDYRDNPACEECGSPGDWITLVRAAFTDDANVARAAINAISTGGGNDEPEAVFSALIRTMSGSEIGGWRKDAERHIILMGDAPGHDPEPWAGGYSYADVLAAWAAETNKISIDPLLTAAGSSFSADANAQFSGLAAGTGGSVRSVAGSNAGEVMKEMVDEFTETPRYPRGDVEALKPTFTFVPPTESMGPPITNILLELQKRKDASDPNSAWKNYQKVRLNKDATSWTPPKPLPQGDYQWRVGYVRGAGTFMLPSAETSKIKAATLMEPNWTEFTRLEVEAAAPTPYLPTTSFTTFTTAVKDVNYSFSRVVNADKYAMWIWRHSADDARWKNWKKLTVKNPTDPNDTVIEVKVKGHTVGTTTYFWQVQSLNYDTPKPDIHVWRIDPNGVLH